MGKGRLSGFWCVEPFGDQGGVIPVDPDEFGKREEALGVLVFFFSVSKARASAEAVVGIGPGIAFEFTKQKAFLVQIKGVFGMDPDLEVMGRGFDDHASGFERAVRKFVMGVKQQVGDIIGQEIV